MFAPMSQNVQSFSNLSIHSNVLGSLSEKVFELENIIIDLKEELQKTKEVV